MNKERLSNLINNMCEEERSTFYATMLSIAQCFDEKDKYSFVLLMRTQVDEKHYALSVAAKNTEGVEDVLEIMGYAADKLCEEMESAPDRAMYN